MIGKLINGKIVYHTPTHRFLSNGNWKNGWSRIKSTGGDKKEYDHGYTDIEMIEGGLYKFTLKNNVAIILDRVK